MSYTLDELLAELAQVVVQLDNAPPDQRLALEARRDELRQFLRNIDVDAQRPTSELLAEHAALVRRLKKAEGERVKKTAGKYLGSTKTVGGGIEPKKINAMIDAGNRIEEIEERLNRLTEILEARGAL